MGLFGPTVEPSKGYPVPSHRFLVEISGIMSNGWFTECNGLSITRDVHEVEEAGQNDYIHKLAGRFKYDQNLTLKHGVFPADDALWSWMTYYVECSNNYVVYRTDITISLYGTRKSLLFFGSYTESARTWVIKDAYPVKWSFSDLNTGGQEIAIESLEIAHHGITQY